MLPVHALHNVPERPQYVSVPERPKFLELSAHTFRGSVV
jgi:hypothetical protein